MSRLNNFLNLYNNNQTKMVYKWGLKSFFNIIYPENISLESKVEKYFKEERNIESDIDTFLTKINGKPPLSIRSMLNTIKNFLIENDVELPQKFWKRVNRRIKGSRALTLDEVPNNKKLRQIFTHMNAKGKALFLILASSGMRIGEALQITTDDLDLDFEPTKITIRGEYTKTGNSRFTFISSEAKEALIEWLKIREQSLLVAKNRSTPKKHYKNKYQEKDLNTKKLFPFHPFTARYIWKNALEKAGLLKRDKTTDRILIHPHVLRKYFRSRMATIIPVDIVEALIGHEGYLTSVYRRYTQKDLAEKYLEAEHTILIFKETGEVTKLRKEVEEKIKLFSSDVDRFRDELAQSKVEVNDLKEKLECAVNYLSSMRAETELREKTEAEENFQKLVEEVNKEHQVPKAETSKKKP